jgi:cytidylate kinase
MRKIALEMGVSLNELGQLAEQDDGKIDGKIDAEVKKAGDNEKIIVDSRLAFHWIPESFKVYLDLPAEIAKERIWENLKKNKLRMDSEHAGSAQEVYQKITERLQSERKRYKELYGIENHTDENNFDLVIDTDKNNLAEVAEIIVKHYKEWISK